MNSILLQHQLDHDQMIAFHYEYEKKAKSKTSAVLFWLFLGQFGAHRFYIGDHSKGIPLLISGIFFFIVLPIGLPIIIYSVPYYDRNPEDAITYLIIYLVIMLFVGIWWIIEGFLLSGKIDRYNEKIEQDIMRCILNTKKVLDPSQRSCDK